MNGYKAEIIAGQAEGAEHAVGPSARGRVLGEQENPSISRGFSRWAPGI